jgi:hypothetical protein
MASAALLKLCRHQVLRSVFTLAGTFVDSPLRAKWSSSLISMNTYYESRQKMQQVISVLLGEYADRWYER